MKIDSSLNHLTPADPENQRTILVVDDEKNVRNYLSKLIEREGHKAVLCHDGSCGLEKLQNGGIDLLITDLRMPGMDGLELIEKVRMFDKEMDIIVITGFGTMEIFIEAMRLGACDFIIKPIERDQFLRAINRSFAKKSLTERLVARTQQLVQSEKMATVGVLSTGIAHEINNPNTFIRTNLQLMSEYIKRLKPRLEDINNAKNAESVRNIILTEFPQMINEALKGTDRIQKIVSGVKHYAYKSEGMLDEDVDIREVIAHAVSLVRAKLRQHITISESYLNLKEIKGDFSKLEQVFVNLLINAADAIEDKVKEMRALGDEGFKGLVDVSATIIEGDELNNEVTPDFLVLTFQDNGTGISKDKLTRVFDPFFTTKSVGVGTGLGLYICYEIIKQHGGAITVQSTKGEGTAFIIKLPVKGAAAETKKNAENNTPDHV